MKSSLNCGDCYAHTANVAASTLPPQPVPRHSCARSVYSATMAASNVQVKFCLHLQPQPKSRFATYGEHYPEQTQKPQNFLLHYSRHYQRCVGSF